LIDRLRALLAGYRFDESSEEALQAGVRAVLDGAGIQHRAEARLTPLDRIDFLAGDVGIECKVQGSLSELIRQLHRYAQLDEIGSLLVLTTKRRLAILPATLNGKRIESVATLGGLR
jgi:hypothetical protein